MTKMAEELEGSYYICTEPLPRCFIIQKISSKNIDKVVQGLNDTSGVWESPECPASIPADFPLFNGEMLTSAGNQSITDVDSIGDLEDDEVQMGVELGSSISNGHRSPQTGKGGMSPYAPPAANNYDVHNKEDLKARLKHQLEYYFSRENLASDTYLRSQMDNDQYVNIRVVANFNMVKRLTTDLDFIVQVLKESDNVQVDEKGEKVRPAIKRDTLIVREIAEETTMEELQNLFSGPDCPAFLSCEFAHNNSWYVTFASDEDAQLAFQFLREKVHSYKGKPIMARIKPKPMNRIPQSVTKGEESPVDVSTTPIPVVPTGPLEIPADSVRLLSPDDSISSSSFITPSHSLPTAVTPANSTNVSNQPLLYYSAQYPGQPVASFVAASPNVISPNWPTSPAYFDLGGILALNGYHLHGAYRPVPHQPQVHQNGTRMSAYGHRGRGRGGSNTSGPYRDGPARTDFNSNPRHTSANGGGGGYGPENGGRRGVGSDGGRFAHSSSYTDQNIHYNKLKLSESSSTAAPNSVPENRGRGGGGISRRPYRGNGINRSSGGDPSRYTSNNDYYWSIRLQKDAEGGKTEKADESISGGLDSTASIGGEEKPIDESFELKSSSFPPLPGPSGPSTSQAVTDNISETTAEGKGFDQSLATGQSGKVAHTAAPSNSGKQAAGAIEGPSKEQSERLCNSTRKSPKPPVSPPSAQVVPTLTVAQSKCDRTSPLQSAPKSVDGKGVSSTPVAALSSASVKKDSKDVDSRSNQSDKIPQSHERKWKIEDSGAHLQQATVATQTQSIPDVPVSAVGATANSSSSPLEDDKQPKKLSYAEMAQRAKERKEAAALQAALAESNGICKETDAAGLYDTVADGEPGDEAFGDRREFRKKSSAATSSGRAQREFPQREGSGSYAGRAQRRNWGGTRSFRPERSSDNY